MRRSQRKLGATRRIRRPVQLQVEKLTEELIKKIDADCGNCKKWHNPLIPKECWTCMDKSNYERVS